MKTLTLYAIGAVFLVLPPVAGFGDELDSIPDNLFTLDDTEVEVIQTKSYNDYWNFSLRVQSQFQKERNSGEDNVNHYLSLSSAGKIPLPSGRFVIDTSLRASYRDEEENSARDHVALDIKELYLSNTIGESGFLDVGRINIRSGFAYGFNPTDYFRPNVAIDDADQDVRRRRNNRLGTVGIRVEKALESEHYSAVYSPAISTKENRFSSNGSITGLHLGQSNPVDRLLLSYSKSSDEGRDLQLYYMLDDGVGSLGIGRSAVVNQKILAYFEATVGRRFSVLSNILKTGIRDGVLPESVGATFSAAEKQLYYQAAIGFSYSSESSVTTNLEYHYAGDGMSKNELTKWYKLIEASPADAGRLWAIRSQYTALDVPINREALWLRSIWDSPFGGYDFGLMVNYIVSDQSYLGRFSVAYDYSDEVELELQFSRFYGKEASFFGSLPSDYGVLLQLGWFF